MDFIRAVILNPVKVTVGVVLVLMFGILAMFSMPMQLTPEVQTPTLTIETTWFGGSPQEVEREIIQPQEEQLKSVEGVTKMSSESMDSLGRVILEFAVGTNMEEALLKVNTRLQQVREYPENADEPVIKTANASDRPIAWFILSPRMVEKERLEELATKYPDAAPLLKKVMRTESEGAAMMHLRQAAREHPELAKDLPPDIDITRLKKFAEDVIEARFERVDGAADANVMGGREEEIQVVVDPEKLAARQITIDNLRAALRGQNKDTSGGDFWEGKRRYVVRTLGQYRSMEQVENTVIADRNGAPVYVRDVARVIHSHKKPDGLVRRLGAERIAVNVLRETGANVLDVMDGLRKAVAELNNGILKQRGLQLSQVYDETDYIYSAVNLVTENLWQGAILTFITLLLFLRNARSTIVIFLHIIVSTVGAFLVMRLLGRSLNVPALGGLAFAVGMLVDNAIVMLENIFRRHQEGEDSMTASVKGASEVWGALANATLANLAVFLPVVFIKEEAGQLFRDIAIAICAAVGLSMFVAVSVVPTVAMRLLRSDDRREQIRLSKVGQPRTTREWVWFAITFPWQAVLFVIRWVLLAPLDFFAGLFVRGLVGLNSVLMRSYLVRLIIVAGFLAGSVYITLLLLPKVEYLPNGNRNLVFGILLPPPGYNLDEMMSMGKQIEEKLRPYWDIEPDADVSKLKYPPVQDYFFVARGRQLFMGLRAKDGMKAGQLVPLVREVAGGFPGTFVVAKQSSLFEQGIATGRTIDIEISGPNIEKLVGLGGQIFGMVMQKMPQGTQALPRPSLDLKSPEVHITPKLEQMAELGLTNLSLGYTVDALVDGAYAGDFFIGGDKIDLRIVGEENLASRTQDLAALPLITPTGQLIPLKAVAEIELNSGPEQINHRERQRAITIQVSPPPDMALEAAMDLIDREIVQALTASGQLEAGNYQIGLAGTADKLRSTWKSLQFNVYLAVIITYLLMAATFESWLYPFVVILTVPLGAVGGFAGLWLLNRWMLQPLDVLTMLGFVMLVGTVVNNPILLVEQALVHMRDDGYPMRKAILESLHNRIRPIFMTTLGGLVGLLPLVLSPGAGSELYRGVGSVLLGGLLVSTVVTLVFVPALLSLTIDTQNGVASFFRWVMGTEPETPAKSDSQGSTAAATPDAGKSATAPDAIPVRSLPTPDIGSRPATKPPSESEPPDTATPVVPTKRRGSERPAPIPATPPAATIQVEAADEGPIEVDALLVDDDEDVLVFPGSSPTRAVDAYVVKGFPPVRLHQEVVLEPDMLDKPSMRINRESPIGSEPLVEAELDDDELSAPSRSAPN